MMQYIGIVLWACVGLVMAYAFAEMSALHLKRVRLNRHLDMQCSRLLCNILDTTRPSGERQLFTLSNMFVNTVTGEFLYMGDRFRKHIDRLPLKRKIEIIDQLLANLEDYSGASDLLTLCRNLNDIEAETIAQIVLHAGQYESWGVVREELPNAIIAFRLKHPTAA